MVFSYLYSPIDAIKKGEGVVVGIAGVRSGCEWHSIFRLLESLSVGFSMDR